MVGHLGKIPTLANFGCFLLTVSGQMVSCEVEELSTGMKVCFRWLQIKH